MTKPHKGEEADSLNDSKDRRSCAVSTEHDKEV